MVPISGSWWDFVLIGCFSLLQTCQFHMRIRLPHPHQKKHMHMCKVRTLPHPSFLSQSPPVTQSGWLRDVGIRLTWVDPRSITGFDTLKRGTGETIFSSAYSHVNRRRRKFTSRRPAELHHGYGNGPERMACHAQNRDRKWNVEWATMPECRLWYLSVVSR